MKPVRIFRHVNCKGPGYLGTVLDNHNIDYELVCIDEGITVPQDLEPISGLVFMGGFMNVTDPLQWIEEEKTLIRKALDKAVPVMGICLGGQLMSAALGGEVIHEPNMEIGWHKLLPDIENKNSKWLQDLPEEFTPFQWHADSFSAPAGATVLLHSECRKNQAFVIGNSIAMQFHLEMTESMIRDWLRLYPGDLQQGHLCAQKAEEITLNLEQKIEALHHCADILYGKWIQGLQ